MDLAFAWGRNLAKILCIIVIFEFFLGCFDLLTSVSVAVMVLDAQQPVVIVLSMNTKIR